MNWFPGDRITEITTYSPGVYNELGLRQDSGTTTMCRTANGKLLNIRVDCTSPRPHNMTYYQLQGTKGVYEAPRIRGVEHMVSFCNGEDPEKMVWQPLSNFEEYLPERYRNASETVKKSSHWGSDYFIVEDFIEAVRGHKPPPVDVYEACEWTAVALLSAYSVANRGRTMDMPDFRAKAHKDKHMIL